MKRDDFILNVAASNGRPPRLVIVEHLQAGAHRDKFDTDSDTARSRFVTGAAERFGVDISELDWLADAIVAAADDADEKADIDAGPDHQREDSQATKLVKLACDARFFHSPQGDAYVRFLVDGAISHVEVARVRSKPFKQWLARRFYVTFEKTPSTQAMQDALGVLEGKAIYDGERTDVHIRVAEHKGCIIVDPCNDAWQAIEVTRAGWHVVDESPVRFRRAKAMLSLPTPIRGGDIRELRQFVNVSDDEWPLLLGWLVNALRPGKPFPILAVAGEQGSAKSTLTKILRLLIDPNTAPLRSEPRDPRDLSIAANNGHVVALDNLSAVKGWLSDCLCRLATGGGFSTRTLFENDEETIFDAMRPCILNGIEDLATRSDLADRSLMLNLPTIPETNRKPESAFWKEFEEARPRIFGALLDAATAALRNVESVKPERLPRMADFALWATAAEESLHLQPGEFMAAYTGNRESANALAIEANPVGKAITSFVESVSRWSGTATELLPELDGAADEKTKRLKSWPASARSLSGVIKRLAPNLRVAGIDVDFDRAGKNRTRLIVLSTASQDLISESSSASSANSNTANVMVNQADGRADAIEKHRPISSAPSSAKTKLFCEEDCQADAKDEADAKNQPNSIPVPF